jgi:hypothetical protein
MLGRYLIQISAGLPIILRHFVISSVEANRKKPFKDLKNKLNFTTSKASTDVVI